MNILSCMLDELLWLLKQAKKQTRGFLFLEREQLVQCSGPHRLVKHPSELSETLSIRRVSESAVPSNTEQTHRMRMLRLDWAAFTVLPP